MTKKAGRQKFIAAPVEYFDKVDALAESWASIDGKLDLYRKGRKAKSELAYGGYFAGYQAEAVAMIARLYKRGWVLRRLPSRGKD